MSEELNLVSNLAIILIAAGIGTIVFKALKQPLILGYIIAGFIIGPKLGLFPSVSSTEAVKQWSEIGIIFLLFCLGLEFSFKKLLKVGSSALITAVSQCIGMFVIGIITANAMGWSSMEGIFLGAMLSMSSTSIVIKAYTDMGYKDKPFAPLVFGTLVVQDLIAVLLLVLLSTVAVSNKFAGGEMAFNLAKLAFCLILWFLVGIYVIPSFLKFAKKHLTDEILLLLSVGLCFLMVTLANLAGFSSALGAFVMGSILAGTSEGERIDGLMHSIKDLFSAIFFVSVGMMIDPAVIAQHWATILIITVVAMLGILVFATSGALLAGKGLDTAVHTGFSLAQLGEFSFIIATMGTSLGVIQGFIYPVIIAVSVITTFAAPYMMKLADPATAWLEKKLPVKVLAKINPRNQEVVVDSEAEKNEWKALIKAYLLRILLYSVILVAILIGSDSYLDDLVEKIFPNCSVNLRNIISVVATLLVMTPFLYGLGVANGSINKHASKLLKEKAANRWPILSLMVIRIFIALGFTMVAISSHFQLAGWSALVVFAAALLLFVAAKFSVKKFSWLENRFIENFNEKEELEKRMAPVTTSINEKLSGYDVHIESMVISSDFAYIGKKLREMPFRHESGVNIVKIQRGTHSIVIPSGDEVIYPGDILIAVGTTEQLTKFRTIVSDNVQTAAKEDEDEFAVKTTRINEESFMFGKDLKSLSMRHSGCMVISVMRAGNIITNPKPDFTFNQGDIVWLAGEKKSCEWFA